MATQLHGFPAHAHLDAVSTFEPEFSAVTQTNSSGGLPVIYK